MISFAEYKFEMTKYKLLYHLQKGDTCALLGFPGTGKTTMTAQIIAELTMDKKEVIITGSTAASPHPIREMLAQKGIMKTVQTIHSLLCFDSMINKLIDSGKLEKVEKKAMKMCRQPWSSAIKSTLQGADFLVIEEISMMTGNFLHAVDLCLRAMRKQPNKKFGGMTLLLVGDFRQLPPVSEIGPRLFQHRLWPTWVDKTFNLEFVLRQKGDTGLKELIFAMSQNQLTEYESELLQNRVIEDGRHKIFCSDFMPEALRVFDTNQHVNEYNQKVAQERINKGCSYRQLYSYLKRQKGKEHEREEDAVFKGAKIVITANIDVEGCIVNGTVGTVLAFQKGKKNEQQKCLCFGYCILIQTESDKTIEVGCHPIKGDNGTLHHIPVRLFYATTVHKLQGQTIHRPLFYMPTMQKKPCISLYIVCTRVTSLTLLHFACLPTDLSQIVDPAVVSCKYMNVGQFKEN